MTFLIGISIVILTATGQILLKTSARRLTGNLIFNPFVISGYILFFLTVVLSFYLLKIMPMKNLVVIMSANYVAVLIAAKIILKENIDKNRMIGTILVALGMLVFLVKPVV